MRQMGEKSVIEDLRIKFQLQKSIELIESCLYENRDPRFQSVYLSVAADYCRAAAEAERQRAAREQLKV